MKEKREMERDALLAELQNMVESGKYMEIAKKKLIGVYGLGGSGGNILASLHSMGLKNMKNVETIAINSDERVLENLKDVDKRVLIGKSVTEHPKGTNGDPNLALEMIEAARESLEVLVKQHEILVLLGSSGGGTSSELMIALSKMGMKMGKVVIAMPVMPFSIEIGRTVIAKRAMNRLKQTGAMVVPLENDSLVRDERLKKLSLNRAFESLNRIIFRKIQEIQDNTLDSIVEAIVEDMYRKLKEAEPQPMMQELPAEIPVPAGQMPKMVTASPKTPNMIDGADNAPKIEPKPI